MAPTKGSTEPDLTRLRQAVDASGEVIFMTDREGVFTFVNPAFERLYGYTSAEVVGRSTPRMLKSGEVRPEEYAMLWHHLLEGVPLQRTFANRTRDGRRVIIEANVSAVRDESGAIVGFLAIQRDVTERVRDAKALAQSQARLKLISDNVLDLVSQIRSTARSCTSVRATKPSSATRPPR